MELSAESVRGILTRFTDEGIVTDWCSEYGEPGYSHDDDATTPVVVLGSYWCRCGKVVHPADHPRAGEPDLHTYETHRPRLWDRLAAQGVQFEWCDEWIVDHENDKAYRTEPDSYSWQPSYVMTEDCELLTPDDDIDSWIEWAANDTGRCIPSAVYTGSDVEAAGFTKHNGQFENGWHPGQSDDPATIDAAIRGLYGDDIDVVFALDSTGQFDIAFSAYWRYDGPRYVATVNMPGYLPMDDDPPVFSDARSAWEYLAEERERGEDIDVEPAEDDTTHADLLAAAKSDEEGTVYGPTPGYDGTHDLGLAYSVSLLTD